MRGVSLLARRGRSVGSAAVLRSGGALGREFKGKGANAILGPSVNVHRVARNGGNFEYLSGEGPYLGFALTAGCIVGVQSEGGFVVVKPWIFDMPGDPPW